ncbi:hypothetical protein KKA47_02785 [bacterium]|nr:hypothetical protein [bacterium]
MSKLIEGLSADISVIPRFIPQDYWHIVEKSCTALTELILKMLSLPPKEIQKFLIPTPITNFLIKELGVLKQHNKRLTGGLRYDFAIEGKLSPDNPPKLLEVNEIGVDGMSRATHICETILKLHPKLSDYIVPKSPSDEEIKNLSRLGKNILRIQYNLYNWEEQVLHSKANGIIDLTMVSPARFKLPISKRCTLLNKSRIYTKNGALHAGCRDKAFNGYMVSYALEYSDYLEAKNLFKTLVKSRAKNYNPFITGLMGPKSSLITLRTFKDAFLNGVDSRLLDKVIPETFLLHEITHEVTKRPQDFVLKEIDGLGGEGVYIGRDILKKLRKIKDPKRWVVQEIVKLNTIDVDGILSRRKKVIADLGVYVHYDWANGKLSHLSVSGAITRASNKSRKVNVNLGGLQVPVMILKN